MSFVEDLTNKTTTTNGAKAFKSSNSAVLDLFSTGPVSNNKKNLIKLAINENPLMALKCALYLRDARNGQGNRDILRELFVELESRPSGDVLISKMIKHIPEIGRWKDVYELWESTNSNQIKHVCMLFVSMALGEKDNLCAKWFPRQSEFHKAYARAHDKDIGQVRREIVALSKTVEQQICKQQWSEIDYSAVPSLANKKYSEVFEAHDRARRVEFLKKAETGEAKMNASVLYPHQITEMCKGGGGMWNVGFKNNNTANALWKNLPNYMSEAKNVLPIIDLSGSMTAPAIGAGPKTSCMDIAIGMGLYFAEHNTGDYKDVWMNFSSNPQAYKLNGDNISERMMNLDTKNWCGSTDVNKAFDFVLESAKSNPESAPEMILIVSDMQFNGCVRQSNHEYYKEQFKLAGIKVPTVVFWRVNEKAKNQPVTKHESGTILIGGYNPNVIKYILSGDVANYNPYTAMCEVLDPMYEWLEE